jgi:hypothetical protein
VATLAKQRQATLERFRKLQGILPCDGLAGNSIPEDITSSRLQLVERTHVLKTTQAALQSSESARRAQEAKAAVAASEHSAVRALLRSLLTIFLERSRAVATSAAPASGGDGESAAQRLSVSFRRLAGRGRSCRSRGTVPRQRSGESSSCS